MMSTARVDIAAGAAMRRRQRRLRSWLKHERMTVAMALAEASHHSAPRGQRTARAGVWGHELNYTATVRDPPTPQPELFSLFDEEPRGSRPDRIPTLSGPQERVQRHTVDQIVDAVPGLPTLDTPVPQMAEQLQDVMRFFDTFCLFPSRLSQRPRSCLMTSPCALLCAIRSWWNSWWSADDHILVFPFAAVYGAERPHSSSWWWRGNFW